MTARLLALLCLLGACAHPTPQAPSTRAGVAHPTDATYTVLPPPQPLPAPAVLASASEPPDGCGNDAALEARLKESADFNAWSLDRALVARGLEQHRVTPIELPPDRAFSVRGPGELVEVGGRYFVAVTVRAVWLASEPGERPLLVPDSGSHVVVARNVRTGAWAVVEAQPLYRCQRERVPTCQPGKGVPSPPVARPRQEVFVVEVPAPPSERLSVEYAASEVGPPMLVRDLSCPAPP